MRKIQIITGTLCLMLLCGCGNIKDTDAVLDNAGAQESTENTQGNVEITSTEDAATSSYSSISISKDPLTPLFNEEHSHPGKKHYETLDYDWEKTSFKRSSENGKEYAQVEYQGKDMSLVVTPDNPAWLEIGKDFIDYGFLGVATDGTQYYISLYTQADENGDAMSTDIMIAQILGENKQAK